MTKEEAINFLQDRINLIDKYYPNVKDYREALDMAIKALEDKGYKQGYADGFAECLELNT